MSNSDPDDSSNVSATKFTPLQRRNRQVSFRCGSGQKSWPSPSRPSLEDCPTNSAYDFPWAARSLVLVVVSSSSRRGSRSYPRDEPVRGSYSARVPRSSLAEVHRKFVHHIVADEVDGQEERQDDRREDGRQGEESGEVEENQTHNMSAWR